MSAEITKADISKAIYTIDENRSAADFAVKQHAKKEIEFIKNNHLENCKPVSKWKVLLRLDFWVKVINFFLENPQILINILKKIK